MKFSSLVGNERVKNSLKRAVAEGRIAQGLIFAGPRGVGKHQFALALAQTVNCERPVNGDACGECLNCRKFSARGFTDVKTITPEGQFIKIDQMRELSKEAYFKPFEGRRRVYIIDEAERLREEAANSILKTLEEPPETSLLILITAKPYALLQTIRSRCQVMNFAPLAYDELEAFLRANYKRPIEETRLLARLARGSIGRALEIDLGEYREKRKALLELVESLALKNDAVRLLGAAEHFGRKLEKEEFERQIELLLILLEDLLYCKLGESSGRLTNADIAKQLERLAETVRLEQVMTWAEKFEEILRNLPRNINRQLALESLFITA